MCARLIKDRCPNRRILTTDWRSTTYWGRWPFGLRWCSWSATSGRRRIQSLATSKIAYLAASFTSSPRYWLLQFHSLPTRTLSTTDYFHRCRKFNGTYNPFRSSFWKMSFIRTCFPDDIQFPVCRWHFLGLLDSGLHTSRIPFDGRPIHRDR